MEPTTFYCQAILGDNTESKAALKLIPELSSCSEQLLEKIFCYSKPVDYKQGEVLITEGFFDQWVYIIVKGELEVIIGDRTLGSTAGPMVGERCILGEPRGASLIAGKEGVQGLGIEMTIIDELQKEIYAIDQSNVDKVTYQDQVECKYKTGVELLGIILNQVIFRIIELSAAGSIMYDYFAQAKLIARKQLQSLHVFSDKSYQQKIEERSLIDEKYGNNINFCSFSEFSKIIREEFQQIYLPEFNDYELFKNNWNKTFAVQSDNTFDIMHVYPTLMTQYNLTYEKLLDFTYIIFEIASKYTASANAAINEVLSLFDCETEKKAAQDAVPEQPVCNITQNKIAASLKEKLFDPINLELNAQKNVQSETARSKMSQLDIDKLFN